MTRRRLLPAFSRRTQSIAWRVIAIVFVVGMALLCWHNIAEALDNPILIHLAYGTGSLPPVKGGTAVVSHASIATASAELTHASAQLQWLIALSNVNSSVLATAVILVFGVIWVRTSAGLPFARSVTVSLTALSIVVAVLGTFQEVLDSWVGLREAYEAVGNLNYSNPYYDQSGFQVTGLAIYIALGIGVLASAFAIGARLTRDTEGLV